MPMPPKKADENLDDWVGTYSDTVTLLLCFFVLLLSASKVDSVMFEQIKAGVQRDFMKEEPSKPVSMLMADLRDDIRELQIDEGKLALGSDHMGLTLDIDGDTLFEAGSAVLTPSARQVIRKIAATLREPRYNIFKFEVQGHTDDTPMTGSVLYPTNWELSSARASAVTRVLIDEGIDPVKLRAVGLADIQPRYPNRDAYGKPIPFNQERNRRVLIRMDPVYK